MSEFWLWFIRPIAEALGAIALMAAFVGLLMLFWGAVLLWDKMKGKK